ncbi:MAG: carbohydrate kinase, partial [Selenomonas sp.]|nr:carbohydrate kinase [Selenomonas sp.]
MVNALERLKNAPVLIIGDMVADVYLDGTIARISREAPVLVLEQREERVVAGGAANVAN